MAASSANPCYLYPSGWLAASSGSTLLVIRCAPPFEASPVHSAPARTSSLNRGSVHLPPDDWEYLAVSLSHDHIWRAVVVAGYRPKMAPSYLTKNSVCLLILFSRGAGHTVASQLAGELADS